MPVTAILNVVLAIKNGPAAGSQSQSDTQLQGRNAENTCNTRAVEYEKRTQVEILFVSKLGFLFGLEIIY